MGSDDRVKEKSYAFALLVIGEARELQKRKEFVLSGQLLRSGTSIGANIEEASAAESRRDFIAKMSVASKEARETDYWVRLLSDSGYVEKERSDVLRSKCLELVRMLTAIVKTSQLNTKN
jgi:four helix bundle protein